MTKSDMVRDRRCRTQVWLLIVITVILGGWALRATGALMVPVVFSVFLALLVAPLDRRVKERVPEKVGWLGHVEAMGAILLALLVVVGLIWVAAQQVVERFPMSVDSMTGEDGTFLPQLGSLAQAGPESPASEGAEDALASSTTAGENAGAESAGGTPSASSRSIIERVRDLFTGAGGSLALRIGEWGAGMASQILSKAGTMLAAMVLVPNSNADVTIPDG